MDSTVGHTMRIVTMKSLRNGLGCGLLFLACCSANGQQILWQFTNDVPQAWFTGSPAVADDGTIYIGTVNSSGTGNKLYAIAPDGSKRWEFYSNTRISTTPVVATNGTVYCGSAAGKVFAIGPDGMLIWDYNIGSEDLRHLALSANGTLYAVAPFYPSATNRNTKSKLVALSADGAKLWHFIDPAIAPDRQPVIGEDGTIYLSTTERFHALNPDGTVYWTLPLISGTAVIGSNGRIYVFGADDTPNSLSLLRALNQDGTADWTYGGAGNLLLGMDGIIIAGPYAFNPQGGLLWSSSYGFERGVIGTGGTMYGLTAGKLAAVGSNGGLVWVRSFPSYLTSSPCLKPDGTLYIASATHLYAVKVSCGMANTPWPMDGHDLRRTGQAGPGSPIRPCLSALRLAPGRGFQFTMIGEVGAHYRIQTSTNLTDWDDWANLFASNNLSHFTDTAASNGQRRFYRAVAP